MHHLRRVLGFAAGAIALSILPVAVVPAGAATTHKTHLNHHDASGKHKGKKHHGKKHHKKHHGAKLESPHIGQVAKDGDFAFTVKSVQCGVTQLGTSTFLGESAPAGSQWCLVSMTVKNDKSTSQSFFASNQYAIDAHGHKLSATSSALFYIPNDSAAELSTVNPGVSISAVVPFQLASTDTISKFELHDSAFSGGVTVYNVGS